MLVEGRQGIVPQVRAVVPQERAAHERHRHHGRGTIEGPLAATPPGDMHNLNLTLSMLEQEGEVTWQYLFPTMLVYQKSGNVANSFFKYPRLLMKVRQKGLLSKTISRGELPLGPIIAPKPSEPGDEDEDPLKPNADGECVVPMLNSARVRMGEVVVIVKFRRGVQQRKPL